MEQLLRDAFKSWQQSGTLGAHPLCDLLTITLDNQSSEQGPIDPVYRRAEALRAVIQSGIDLLGPEDEDPPSQDGDPKWYKPEWRYYNILTLSLAPNATPLKIADKIGLALGGHFYDEKSKAFRMLATVLQASQGPPLEEDEPIKLELPPSGGAIRITDKHYIERQADADLTLHSKGQTFIIRGSRQMGKTSLLIRGANHLRRQYAARVVHFDFQTVDQLHLTSLESVLYQLAQTIVYKLSLDQDNLEGIWRNRNLAATLRMERLLENEVLSAFDVPIVLALDEVDRLLPTDFRQDFFAMLRAWHNNRATGEPWDKLNLILVISTEPYLLIDDLYQSPFNVGQLLYLDDFNRQQVEKLNQLYGFPLSKNNLTRLMELLNGHPYLTNVALYSLKVKQMAWPDLERAATSDEGPFAEHLRHLHQLLNHKQSLKIAFVQISEGEKCSDEQAQFQLLKAGVIKKHIDHYVCRCQLYRRYFRGRL